MYATWITQQIVFNGVVRGATYGLLAMCIVLVYRSSKVINFAAGNMGLVGTGLFIILIDNYGVPFWLAMAISLLAGAAFGAVIELLVIRRLFTAPRVIVLVATIGVSQLSVAALYGYPDLIGSGHRVPQTVGSVWSTAHLRITGAQVMILVVAPLLAAAIGLFFRYSLLGRAIRAAAGNPDLARLKTINPKLASTATWMVGGFVSTVAMLLVAQDQGKTSQLVGVGPSWLMRAIVAAVIAGLSSLPVALLAALCIGVGEQVVRFNFSSHPGITDILLLVTALVVVAWRSRRAEASDAVFSFSPKIEPMPERLRSIWWVRNLGRASCLALLAVAAVLPLVFTKASNHLIFSTIVSFAVIAMSMTVLTGWAGQLSLGSMGFAGFGALSAAAFTTGLTIDWKIASHQLLDVSASAVPFALAVPLAALLTGALAALIGFGALRLRGLLLAATTFAFTVAATTWLFRLSVLSRGNDNSVPLRRGSLLGLDLVPLRTYYWTLLVVLALVFATLGRLRRTGFGRVTLAVRDNSLAAAAYTVRPSLAKLRAFVLSGFLAGLGGAMLAGTFQRFDFSDRNFFIEMSLTVVAMAVIGGMGSPLGAVLGALWVKGLSNLAPSNQLLPLLTSGAGLTILLLYFPGGFSQIVYRARGALYRHLEGRLPPPVKHMQAAPAALSRRDRPAEPREIVLRTERLTVRFGGVRANDEISIEVGAGEIVGLIGTNGAGKTTLMNAVGGYVPASGRVELLGRDISGLAPASRARRGLGRTFQAATLFPELTVRESVLVALEARGRSSLVETIAFSPRARRQERAKAADAAELIDFLGLGRYADRQINELSTGTRRIVELAGLLALDACVLCLDEPTAGIAQREAEKMGPLLVEINRQLGAAMLIIEHDMPLVMGMSDRVYCLELGAVIAHGSPAEVRDDPLVIASYLGTDPRTIARSGTA